MTSQARKAGGLEGPLKTEAHSPRLCASAGSGRMLTEGSEAHQEEDPEEPVLSQGSDRFPEQDEVLVLAVLKGRALHRGTLSCNGGAAIYRGGRGSLVGEHLQPAPAPLEALWLPPAS